MAITAFVPAAVPHAGYDLDAAAVTPGQTTGNTCPGSQNCELYVKNASGGSITVTVHFTPTNNTDGNAVASRVVTVLAGHAALIPMLDMYEDPTSGLITIDFSSVTSVTACAVICGS